MLQVDDQAKTVFSTRLPRELVRRIRVHAATIGREIEKVVAEILDKHIPKIDRPGK